VKTMEDTMVLITQSFDLAVRQAGVLYGGPPPLGQFDREMEVLNDCLVPTDEVQVCRTSTNQCRARMLPCFVLFP